MNFGEMQREDVDWTDQLKTVEKTALRSQWILQRFSQWIQFSVGVERVPMMVYERITVLVEFVHRP
jgi:hypothetical protein